MVMGIGELAEKCMADLWDTKRVALSLGVCCETVRRFVRRGQLPAIRVGSHVLRFHPLDVDRLRSRGEREVSERVYEKYPEKKPHSSALAPARLTPVGA